MPDQKQGKYNQRIVSPLWLDFPKYKKNNLLIMLFKH